MAQDMERNTPVQSNEVPHPHRAGFAHVAQASEKWRNTTIYLYQGKSTEISGTFWFDRLEKAND